MISKTLTGTGFFDQQYGGTYRGRAMLVTGRANSGKTLFGLQFIMQGVRQGERCLLLSGRQAADAAIYAEAIGFPLGEDVENGTVMVLEYSDYVPGRDTEKNLVLPPEGFVQLQEIIRANAIQRVVLDTCLPWVTLPNSKNMPEHVFSFIRSFDRLGATTVLTLPKPVSPIAFKLKSVLEDIVPVAVSLTCDENHERRQWIVNKYLGETRLEAGMEFDIVPGVGLQARNSAPAMIAPQPETAHPPAAASGPPPALTPPSPKVSGPIRFSDVMTGKPPPSPLPASPMGRTAFSEALKYPS